MGEHIEKVMSYLPQAQGLNFAEMMALSKKEGGGFGEGGQGMMFLLFLLLLTGRGGSVFGNGADTAAAVNAGITRSDLQILIEQLNGVQSSQVQGFAGLNTVIQDSRYQTAAAISGLGSDLTSQITALAGQLSHCCCNIERSIDRVSAEVQASACAVKEAVRDAQAALGAQATQNQFTNLQNFSEIKFQSATDKSDILRAIQDSEQTIICKLNADKFASIEAENCALKLSISQEQQTAALIAALKKG